VSLGRRFHAIFNTRTAQSDLNDELRFHMEKEIEQNIARGMSPEEARRQALIAFGGVQQTRENVRRVRWTHFVEILAQDLSYTVRMLRKNPTFAAVIVLTLALTIGMNTAIFSVIDAVMFRRLPVRDPAGLVVFKWVAREEPTTQGLWYTDACNDRHNGAHHAGCALPLPLLKEVHARTKVFSGLAAFGGAGFAQIDLSGTGPAKRVQGNFVSGDYFELLGVRPATGRMFSETDDRPEAPPVTILSYKFWQSDFGGSPTIVGKTVRLNNKPYTVIGVAESSFTALTPSSEYDLWVPLAQQKNLAAHWMPVQAEMSFFGYVMLGRVKPGVPLSQAEAAANLAFRNATMLGAQPSFNAEDDPHLRLMAAQQELRGPYGLVLRPVYVLMLCVGIILLIACANVAGLLLARAARREREMAVRLALGAKRGRLLAQLLVESLTLSAMGGALGLMMALWSTRALMTLLFGGHGQLPGFSPRLDWRVLAFTAGVSILTGLVFGMAPALRGLRVDLTPALKTADTSGGDGVRHRRFSMGRLLVATQVALAVLLLATAGLLLHTLTNLKNLDPGFDTNNLLLFGVDPRLAGYNGQKLHQLYHELQEKFSALPAVKSVSYSWAPLLVRSQFRTSFRRPGTPVESTDQVSADILAVGPNFFATLRIPLEAGRDLSAAEFAEAAMASLTQPRKVPVPAVVNLAFVRAYVPDQNPLGKVFADAPAGNEWPANSGYQIVGVVGDAKYNDLRGSINPTIYYPVSDQGAFFELRTAGDPALLIPTVRNTVSRVDDNLALFRVDTQKRQIDRLLSDERMMAQLSTFFGLLALLLASTGIYGLLSYEVTRRTREICIRMAIGAQQSDVVGMVVRQGLLLALAGAVIGTGASFAIKLLLEKILYHVRAGDPVTLAAVTGILLVVALAACFLPARRATRVDPLVALRYE
jgi:predicted permease